MSNQPTSRPEPEALHRSMMQALLQHSALDRRVEEERRRDGLAPFLQVWLDAAAGLRAALGKARANLEAHGTAREHLERIDRRLDGLKVRAAAFDVAADLDECVASWGHLAHDVAGLSGPRRDELLRFLAARKDVIDRATAGLSQARKAGGVHPEQRARLRAVEDERERARERYAGLRDDYLRAVRGHGRPHPSGALAPLVVTLPELLAPRGALRSASPRLDAVIERDRHLRVGVAQRFEKTLGSLATASHRTLTDPRAGELRGHLARMDGILARLQGKRSASELSSGAREVGGLLAQMGDLASARGSAAALKPFRALLEERRAALARLAGEAQKAAGAQALHQRGALLQPSAMALGEEQLQTLRKLHPGIETLLRDASASQLAAELRRPEAHSPLERAQGRLGATGLAGVGQAIAGAHLGGFGPARGGGLGALREHGAIGRALGGHRGGGPAHAQVRELHELLGTLREAPPGSPLHQIAAHADDRRRQLADRAKARLHGRGPAHGVARALADAFHAHGRSDFAAHVAPGGALYHLLQGAQRSHGLPVPHFASHFLQSRGAHPLAGTLQLFDHLSAEGYPPHFGLFSRLKHAAGDAFHKATTTIAHTADDVKRTASGLARAAGGGVRSGLSDLGHHALDAGQRMGMGIGALTGAATALASGRSLKDAVEGAGAGAVDSFNPGALKALGRLEGVTGVEKPMGKRSMRRAVKGSILLSGKAAKAQGYLDRALAMGDRLEGGLSAIHQLAPEVAGAVGDDALGHLIARAGDFAGEGDDRLKRTLEMGRGASGRLQQYRGYLDKELGYAGVKDPKKAYGRMIARKDAREGKREGIEAVARDKLARHRLRHPELHEALRAPRRIQLDGGAPAARVEVAHESDAERSRRQVDEIAKHLGEARRLARGNEKYEKEIAFYEEWQQKARASVHAAIAGGKDLGKHVGVSGQGISEQTRPDVYRNTRAIFAVQGRTPEAKGARAPKAGGLRKSAEHGLANVQRLQRNAVRMGRKLGHDKLHGALQVAARGKKGLHEGRMLLEEALHLGAQRHVEKGHREHPRDGEGPVRRGHPDEPQREHIRGLDPAALDGPHPAADAHMAVQAAAHAVGHFGSALDGAVKAVQRLLERDRGAEAADRIRSVEMLGDEAGAAVKDAARAAANDPALAGSVAKLRENLEEMRAHFRQFVSGLRGLASKDGAFDRERPGERDGDPRRRPGGRRGRRPQGDLVDEVLRGIDDGRLFVDRGAHRGERPEHDGQEVDPAAIDSWIGSGEGVKLFSDVFGAFLPAEGPARRGPRHRPRGGRGSRGGHRDEAPHEEQRPGRRRGKGGFFAKVFEKAEDFAEGVAHAAHGGARLLGKATHYAEMGMHGLNVVEHAAEKVHDFAGRAEGFLYRMHLGSAAGFAHEVGAAAGWVDARAEEAHGGLKTADEALGEGKHDLEVVESFGHGTAKIARKARKGHFGDVLHLFRAATHGDGTDGRLRPEQVRLGSALDEPRRLDALTQARMEQFLGGDFTGVRVHVGPGAAQITSRYAAEAVTVRDHIFFAPGKFRPGSVEGEKLLAHELTHVLQKGRKNLDVRTAEAEALHAEHSYGSAPAMETLNLSVPAPDFKLPDGEGAPASDGIHTAKRTRSRAHDAGGKDDLPDGEEFLEKVSGRVYDLLMDELEQSFESR